MRDGVQSAKRQDSVELSQHFGALINYLRIAFFCESADMPKCLSNMGKTVAFRQKTP
jgi:hypothetical protein